MFNILRGTESHIPLILACCNDNFSPKCTVMVPVRFENPPQWVSGESQSLIKIDFRAENDKIEPNVEMTLTVLRLWFGYQIIMKQ